MGTLIKIAVAYGGYVVWHNKHKAVAHTFEVHGSEAYDAATNLTWKRCGVGQEFTDGNCGAASPATSGTRRNAPATPPGACPTTRNSRR